MPNIACPFRRLHPHFPFDAKSRLALLQTGKRAHDTELLFQILIQVPRANFILRLMNTTERLWS